MTAEPPGSPVTEGVRSMEVRWIFPGQLETAVAGWKRTSTSAERKGPGRVSVSRHVDDLVARAQAYHHSVLPAGNSAGQPPNRASDRYRFAYAGRSGQER
jgi:hypothetical protein